MNSKRTNQINSKPLYTIDFDFPKILIVLAIIMIISTIITIIPTCEYMPGLGFFIFLSTIGILAITLLPLFMRSNKAYIQITDTAVIVNDWFFVKVQKSYRLDTITNVAVSSFLGFNTLVLDITQGDALKTKRLMFSLIKNPDDVYLAISGLIDCVKNDNDVLVELAQDKNTQLEKIANSLKNTTNI